MGRRVTRLGLQRLGKVRSYIMDFRRSSVLDINPHRVGGCHHMKPPTHPPALKNTQKINNTMDPSPSTQHFGKNQGSLNL